VKRFAVGFRVAKDVRERLEAAARTSGRSLSQEAETRLLFGLRDERTAGDILDFRYGLQTGVLLRLIGEVLTERDDWLSHPLAYSRVRAKINLILDALATGEPPPEQEDIPPGWTPITPEEDVRQTLGRLFASSPAPLYGDLARELWLRLGDAAVRRIMIWLRRRP
jgi:hypothetical protein